MASRSTSAKSSSTSKPKTQRKSTGSVKITSPWSNYTGETAGVSFVNGVAETTADNPQIAYFQRAGYGIEGTYVDVEGEKVTGQGAAATLDDLDLEGLRSLATEKQVTWTEDMTEEHLRGLLDGKDGADGNEGASNVPPAGQENTGSASA